MARQLAPRNDLLAVSTNCHETGIAVAHAKRLCRLYVSSKSRKILSCRAAASSRSDSRHGLAPQIQRQRSPPDHGRTRSRHVLRELSNSPDESLHVFENTPPY